MRKIITTYKTLGMPEFNANDLSNEANRINWFQQVNALGWFCNITKIKNHHSIFSFFNKDLIYSFVDLENMQNLSGLKVMVSYFKNPEDYKDHIIQSEEDMIALNKLFFISDSSIFNSLFTRFLHIDKVITNCVDEFLFSKKDDIERLNFIKNKSNHESMHIIQVESKFNKKVQNLNSL